MSLTFFLAALVPATRVVSGVHKPMYVSGASCEMSDGCMSNAPSTRACRERVAADAVDALDTRRASEERGASPFSSLLHHFFTVLNRPVLDLSQ